MRSSNHEAPKFGILLGLGLIGTGILLWRAMPMPGPDEVAMAASLTANQRLVLEHNRLGGKQVKDMQEMTPRELQAAFAQSSLATEAGIKADLHRIRSALMCQFSAAAAFLAGAVVLLRATRSTQPIALKRRDSRSASLAGDCGLVS